ncbi:MAG TPA: hypothetical protein VN631_18535 [Negativicutes bacterium]|nr:hypothetical protein [Negativicutes bacterium]
MTNEEYQKLAEGLTKLTDQLQENHDMMNALFNRLDELDEKIDGLLAIAVDKEILNEIKIRLANRTDWN